VSELENIRNKVQDLVVSAYGKMPWFGEHDAVSLLINDNIAKNQISTDTAILRHVEINPYFTEIRDVEKETRGTKWDKDSISDTFEKVKSEIQIEMIPKKNITHNDTFEKTIEKMYDIIGKDFRFDSISIDGLSGGLYMRDKKRLNFEYERGQKEDRILGFVTIAERGKSHDRFDYPQVKSYKAPTLFFNLYNKNAETHLKILDRMYQKL